MHGEASLAALKIISFCIFVYVADNALKITAF